MGYLSSVRYKYPQDDGGWFVHILNHRDTIVREGTVVQISLSDMQTYRHRPLEFLSAYGLDASVLWIFLFINNIQDSMSFFNLSEVIIPSEETLDRLRTTYTNSSYTEAAVVDTLSV